MIQNDQEIIENDQEMIENGQKSHGAHPGPWLAPWALAGPGTPGP